MESQFKLCVSPMLRTQANLLYMSWVRENVADGQQVRGIVIAKEIDEALRFALKGQPVDIKTYEVSFRLKG